MNTDLLLDAVRAEAAYRAEELKKAGRGEWVGRVRRATRRMRAERFTDVEVPAQRRHGSERASAGVSETTR
ncbi:hypothetical protein ACFWY9_17200 [Amycolatopsis sp. NPDC059027]|uniref:hypothetical protein n=1 Tax=unclassified Amycolatopsis TaxID=2618356 RepID=UPI00366D0B06